MIKPTTPLQGATASPGTTAGKLPPWPDVDHSQFGEVESRPIPRIQKMVGDFLARNWLMIPHVTHNDEADVTNLEAHRKQLNSQQSDVKITSLPFIIKAVVSALQQYPQFNVSLDSTNTHLIYKSYYHIGVAVDTPNGLLVPVIRDCDKKTVPEIAFEIAKLSQKAREKGLSMQEMSGGCFSISVLGAIGGTSFTPIINAPEVAILGVTRTREQPVREGNNIGWRLMLPLSLSYDHRVINGADAARFTQHICKILNQTSDIQP